MNFYISRNFNIQSTYNGYKKDDSYCNFWAKIGKNGHSATILETTYED